MTTVTGTPYLESRDPGSDEPRYHGGGGDVVELRHLDPPGVAVDHRQQVAEPLQGGQGPHYVDVHLGEPPGGHGDLPQLRDPVPGDLGHLTQDALLAPPGDVRLHPLPDSPLRDESPGGSRSRMGEVVYRVKHAGGTPWV